MKKCPKCKRQCLLRYRVAYGDSAEWVYRCIGMSGAKGCGYQSERGKKRGKK